MNDLLVRLPASARWLALICGAMLCVTRAGAVDSAALKNTFANPPRQFASAPLWVWNDLLTERQIRDTMRDLAGQKVKQVFVHPRPGLMTPYLGSDWFRLWKVALDEAERLDMNVWIYDENSYPSGFAGGWVPELMPESRGRGLQFREAKSAPKWEDQTLAVFRLADGQAENVSSQIKAGEALAGDRFLAVSVVRAGNSPWHGGRCYVDLLYPGVTEKFLEVTMGAYEKEIGRHFGKRVPGIFTDEPEIRPAGAWPWTDDMPAQFEKRWGYSLLDNLASLTQPVGDWRRVRHDYCSTLLDLFIERWAKPYYDCCERRGLEFTGHYWEHEWPNCIGVPDSMAMAAWQQRPGIDILMNQYAEHTHAQFGNVRSCREISSVANQLGRPRTLVELYGAGGWDLRFEDMKRIGDWLQVLGVNTFDEHLSSVTIRGARKNDHPQSFSYHEPWWPAYHAMAEYFTRLSAALSQGEQINRILLFEPTTTAWMYQGDQARLNELGNSFSKLIMALEAAQIEYDIGCEDVIARHGSVRDAKLWVGQRGYDVVVLPPGMENVKSRVAALGEEFLTAGGSIVCLGQPPSRVGGRESQRPSDGVDESGWFSATVDEAPALLRRWNNEERFNIRRNANDRGILFHMRRQLSDGELVFLVNTSIEFGSAGSLESNLRGIERWDPQTGKTTPHVFRKSEMGAATEFSLPPCGSMLLFLSKRAIEPAPAIVESAINLDASGPAQVRRLTPNVLRLDYVDITAGGQTRSNVYYYAAAQFAFQKNGLDHNPWDSAVQFKDELISKKFPADSGFSASYKFTIEGSVPANLAIVIERPDLYAIACNGRPVSPGPIAQSKSPPDTNGLSSIDSGRTVEFKDWWLDRAFGRIPIANAARSGDNIVTLTARPFTMWHELEAAFVLGDFTLKPSDRGFVMSADVPLRIGKRQTNQSQSQSAASSGRGTGGAGLGWNDQGHPFYADRVSYRQLFQVSKPTGRYVVDLPDWHGSVAEVKVNGKPGGYIVSSPWECDVTKLIRRGSNEVDVQVIGTLKNTLGPHHGKPGLGSAWPGMFRNGPDNGPPPGADYHTVAFGLFEPFLLKQLTASPK